MAYLFASIFAALVGASVISAGRMAFDSLSPFWFSAWIGLVLIVVIGALLLDRNGSSRNPGP